MNINIFSVSSLETPVIFASAARRCPKGSLQDNAGEEEAEEADERVIFVDGIIFV
jgi:hypothetical protein